MNDACVLGWGTVGKSTALAFGIKKYCSRSEANITLPEANECRFIFICLPTPTTVDGKCFTQDIFDVVKQLSSYPRHIDNIYIIRSTVYPGFATQLETVLGIDNVVSNPEFLSNDTWEEDAKHPKMVVIGGNNSKYREVVKGLYRGRYTYLEPIVTDTITAELIKYAFNSFFATKVIFCNEIFDYAQKVKANYETIRKALESHPWGMKNHTQIWYKEKRGLHGKCLPKDIKAFAEMTGSLFFKTLITVNEKNL